MEHAITFTEQKLIDRGAGWGVPKWDYVSSGNLTLMITNVRLVRQRWTESPDRPLEGMLNKFIIGLVRAAISVKEQRAEAERQERARQQEDRRRAEAEERRKAEQAWQREESGCRKRFDTLVEYWRENERRRGFLQQLRDAIGEVPAISRLGEWLVWAENYVGLSDPLARFRHRGKSLTLYLTGAQAEIARIRSDGFREPEPPSIYSTEAAAPPGIKLEDIRPEKRWSTQEMLELELPEEVVLPFEVTQPGYVPRRFYVPARVLNCYLAIGLTG